jgi:hypothetical protein
MTLKIAGAVVALGAMCFVGCASRHEEGVKSTYRTQSTMVNADTAATTEAAEAVLNDRELKDVNSSSTRVDGKATGKMADGTKVNVAVQKNGDNMSSVAVNVGLTGDPSLGAEIAKAIKTRAEGGSGGGTMSDTDRPTTRRSTMSGGTTSGGTMSGSTATTRRSGM